jgi:hypothetical protein
MSVPSKILNLVVLIFPVFAFGQSTSTLMGARSNGLAYASACLEDEWGIFNNVSGIARVKSTAAGVTYDANPTFKSFNRMAAICVVPSKLITTGLGVYRFGDDLYNEQVLALGVANKFGIASLGVKINYIQYFIEGFGSRRIFTVSFGGIAQLTPHLSVGAHITNINPPKLSPSSNEVLPTVVTLGIGFKPSEKLFMTSELEKDLDVDLKWKAGFEYSIHKKISARTGYILKPQAGFFGLGFKPKKFQVDYCVQMFSALGLGHQVSVGYRVNTKGK